MHWKTLLRSKKTFFALAKRQPLPALDDEAEDDDLALYDEDMAAIVDD